MKKIFVSIFCLAVTGCSSPGTGQRVGLDALATGGGGMAAYYASGKDPAVTTAGAVGGFVVSEALQSIAASGRKKAYKSGIEEGKAIGQEQILQGLWEQSNGLRTGVQKSQTTKILLPARVQNGVRYDAVPMTSEDTRNSKLLIPSVETSEAAFPAHYERPTPPAK